MRFILLALALATAPAHAQSYPTRPVRVLVGFTPGGGVDINARLLAAKLSALLGQQFVVENKPGAGTNIANESVAKSVADGYTLLFTSPAVAINMSLYRNPPYDALRDFAGVSIFSESTNLLVVPAALAAHSVQDLVAMAKAQPGALNYSSAGQGTTQHLAGELFKLRTGTSIVHVPYKGSAPAMTALISGDVQLGFINPVAAGPHVTSGRLRALAVAGAKRSALFPDVPTMKEAGFPGVEVALWYGLLAPKQTPRDVVQLLAAAVAQATRDDEVRKRLAADGAEPVGNTPAEFDRQLKEDLAKYGEVVRVSGAKAN
jgi:tripartite-type tricarboxylate transporter receptor subunit TctC